MSPIYKKKYPHGFSGVGWHHSEETKTKLKKTMNSPEVREKIASKLRGEQNPFYGRHHTQESIQRANAGKRAWLNNPENWRKILEAGYKGWLILTKQLQKYLKDGLPNPSERQLLEILEECSPGEYKYNDGWFRLGGKFPDFVNINGEKKIIELFGEAYHKPEEVDKKQEFYRQLGWRTLIIWAKELSDRQKVKERILSFTERG